MSQSTPPASAPPRAPGSRVLEFDRVIFDNVSRHFGRRRALARLSLTCHAGEIVGLLGPNGAGKSTLLGLAAGALEPSAGEVRYGEHAGRRAGAALRARIGLMAHELQLYPELTARENLEFFGGLYGVEDPRGAAAAALERAGLTARSDDLVSGFSRGMRQRLGLERALLHGPRLVLLDEPFTGLDERSSEGLCDRLRDLRARHHIVVLATHDFETADALVDRAALLLEGRLTMLEPGGLRERYRAQVRALTGAGRPTPAGAGP